MISPSAAVERLQAVGTSFFVGVPDSLLKPFGQHVAQHLPRRAHIIAANEGAAVGIAIGHHLRTGRTPLVYLQNSGLGNTVNPLLSLADPAVYGIPMILLIGWRGEPGVKDEPQHVTQGRVMISMLESMEIAYVVLPSDESEALDVLEHAHREAARRSAPFAVLVRKGTFASESNFVTNIDTEARATREAALGEVIASLPPTAITVSTTGMLSRELFELRAATDGLGASDFLTVGGMGHAAAIALGVALEEPTREVWCLDGDGALLMHTGTAATIADHGPPNLRHIVFNNGVHDSVGGQPTSISSVDVPALGSAMGYLAASSTSRINEIRALIDEMRSSAGPSLLEILVRPGARDDLGRPTRSPVESKEIFMGGIR